MRTLPKALSLLAVLSTTAIAPIACSSKPPPPPATPTGPADAGLEAAADASADLGDAGAGDAAPVAVAPTIPLETLDAPIDALIAGSAAKVAPKMTPEGQPGRATLAENEHFNMLVTLQPNRCYTFVAAAAPGTVTQLDLKLLAPPFYNVESGRSGAADKNVPVVGKGTAALCPILPLAVAYKLDAVATKGAGRIAVHVYSRAK